MHLVAVVLVALAGIAFCLAALLRWRSLQRGDVDPSHTLWPLWGGLGLLSLGLVVSLIEGNHLDFTYAVIGSWAALASVIFLARFLTLPSRGLLLLPIGGMALLVAAAQMADHLRGSGAEAAIAEAPGWMTVAHVAFMATHMAAILIAGAGGVVWLVARRQLKAATPAALQLPSLPMAGRLVDRGLVVATGLLLGGLATGSVAITRQEDFSLLHGAPLLALVEMGLLVVLLALRASGNGHRRSMAWGAIVLVVVTACSAVSLLVGTPHA